MRMLMERMVQVHPCSMTLAAGAAAPKMMRSKEPYRGLMSEVECLGRCS